MNDPDAALETLNQIIGEFAQFVKTRGGASETDTRVKMIDRVLTEILGWPEADISREDHVTLPQEEEDKSGYIDYTLALHGHPYVAVEAKKEGVTFTLPHRLQDRRYTLDGALVTDPGVRKAVLQVRRYCDEAPVPIKYAIATNGYTWIVFRAVRDDIGWRKGRARVFPSIEYIRDNFTEFWNLLSYARIESGSLQEEFSQVASEPRQMLRVLDRLFNSELPLRRNRLNTAIQPFIGLIFEDIADQDQIEVLQSCYVHTGSLKVVQNDLDHIITESIPHFLKQEGTMPTGGEHDSAGFEAALSRSLGTNKGRLFLLLGGIGCGKTTFLKRYQRTTAKEMLEKQTLWFTIDFLESQDDPAALERFVWQNVLDDIRKKYADRGYEKLKSLREIFAPNIAVLESSVLAGHKKHSPGYAKALAPYLVNWQADLANYVPKLLQHACLADKKKPVLFVDNVDQLSPLYQGHIFLLAQRVTRILESITLVSLREESYYTASIQQKFTAFTNHKFHIASPRFRILITNRIAYAVNLLDERDKIPRDEIISDYRAIRDFLLIVRDSIFGNNKQIVKFIEATCYGNMRVALQFFTTFLTSGVTDVDKMLRIYWRDGGYNVAFHEFIKSIMLGERRYYKEEQSPVMNLYNVGAEKNSSHFTHWRIIRVLYVRRGGSGSEGTGYVPLSELISVFENVFNNRGEVIAALNRLIKRQLIEANTRSTETIAGASHVRVTSAGWYYVYFLAKKFAYLDLVLQDTPLSSEEVEAFLRQSVFAVDNLHDREDEKLQRLRVRFTRVEKFLEYLKKEEEHERAEFNLEQAGGVFGDPIVPAIEDGYLRDKAWIEKRIRENRERYADEPPAQFDSTDALEAGQYDEEEETSEIPPTRSPEEKPK
jgi:hypothetical protein